MLMYPNYGKLDNLAIAAFVLVTVMFLALSDITGKKISQQDLAAGLRTDGVGTLLGGIFNTFPYTSFSQNVGLVSVTGVKSRWVCVAGGVIMIVLGLLPKISALAEWRRIGEPDRALTPLTGCWPRRSRP